MTEEDAWCDVCRDKSCQECYITKCCLTSPHKDKRIISCSLCDYGECYQCSDTDVFLDTCKWCEFVVCTNCDASSYLHRSGVCVYCIQKETGHLALDLKQVYECWECEHYYIDKNTDADGYTCTRCDTPKKEREDELTAELNKVGLTLRSDSVLCRNYIKKDEGCVEDIVKRMCEMKYLHEYTDFKTIKQQVYEDLVKEDIYTGDGVVFREAEMRIISGKPYPRIWPWQINKAARIIQKKMMEWLYKPYTKDGKVGLMPMRRMRELGVRGIPVPE